MFLRKKAQSTAEYAITIALVIAVTAGVLQIALKGGIRQKNKQALNYLLSAGDNVTDFANATGNTTVFTQEYRNTTVDSASYIDKSVMKKGGAEEKQQEQSTTSTAVSVELMKGI